MSLTEPTLADPITPSDAWRQAAARETPFGQYIGEKLLGGLEATRPVAALEMAMLPPRSGVPDEYGIVAPPDPSPVLSKETWEGSPDFRPGIEYDPGMTQARAEALATQHDRLEWNNSLIARYQGGFVGEAAGFVAGLAPGVADPTNYVPLLGPAAKAAMVARLGVIGGNIALHGAEAAANSALFEPLTAEHAATFGQPYGWQDAAADIALGSLAGAVGGAIHGGLEYRGSLREAATRTRLETVMAAADAASLAAEQVDRGLPVDVAPVLAGRLPEAPRAATFDVGGIVPRRAGEARAPEDVGTTAPQGEAAPEQPPAAPYKVEITSSAPDRDGAVSKTYRLLGPDGEHLATAEALVSGDEVRIGNVATKEGEEAEERGSGLAEVRNKLGPRAMIALAKEIARDNPGAARMTGERIGGARFGGEFAEGDRGAEASISLDRFRRRAPSSATAAPEEPLRVRQDAEGNWWRPVGPDEILQPGAHVRMDVTTGLSEMKVSAEEAAKLRAPVSAPAPSFATAAPEEPHPSVAEAAKRVGKAEADPLATFKKDAGLEGYQQPLPGHEPKPEPAPGEPAKPAKPERPPTREEKAAALAALPPELAEIEAMRREGSFRPEDEATLAAGEAEAQRAEGYAAAWQTLASCVLRNA